MSDQVPSIWRNPLLFLLITALGLASAIFGDGIWDIFCWLFMSPPLVYIFIRIMNQRRAPQN